MIRVLVLALLAACPAPERPQPPPPTTPLSIIEASPDLDGKIVGPSTARATIIVLMASWCGHCKTQLAQLADIRTRHPFTRVLGVNYKGHEEYDNRGNATLLRAYLEPMPWLRVVPAGEKLFDALGRPPFVPAVWVYGARGDLIKFYDRREREPPSVDEIEALLVRLGA
jgi:thiol-disulfide isomerase/thioredoxin